MKLYRRYQHGSYQYYICGVFGNELKIGDKQQEMLVDGLCLPFILACMTM